MAFLNSSDYESLGDYSPDGGRESGPFISAFVSSEPRPNQTPGMIHSILDWHENDTDKKFLLRNKEEVWFLPLFIKKIRQAKDSEGKITYFSYRPDEELDYPQSARVAFILAGILLDDSMNVVKNREDETLPQLIHWKAAGIKVGGVIDYINEIGSLFESHDRICEPDEAAFERSIVTPRRFVTKVTVATAPSNYGNKYVYKFTPEKKLPNERVKEIMDSAVKWKEAFDLQFNITDFLRTKTNQTEAVADVTEGLATFESTSESQTTSDEIPVEDIPSIGLF